MMGTHSTLFFSSIGFKFEKTNRSGSWHRFLNDRHFQESCLSHIPLGGTLKIVLCYSLLEFVPIMFYGIPLFVKWPRVSTTFYHRLQDICAEMSRNLIGIELQSRWGTVPLKGGLWWLSRYRWVVLSLTCVWVLLLGYSYLFQSVMTSVLAQYQDEFMLQRSSGNKLVLKEQERRTYSLSKWGRVGLFLDSDVLVSSWKDDARHCEVSMYIPRQKLAFLQRSHWFSKTDLFSDLVLEGVTLLSSPELDYLHYRVRYNYI